KSMQNRADDHRPYIPLAVSAVGGKHFYHDDRESEDHVYCTYEFPGPNYDPSKPVYDRNGNAVGNDVITVTYSSINTNGFDPSGECLMGTKGTMVVEGEQNAMLWAAAGRSTAVTVNASGGRPALDSGGSMDAPKEARAGNIGDASLGGPISRGYREEMEHF